jgi:hypothetical protein
MAELDAPFRLIVIQYACTLRQPYRKELIASDALSECRLLQVKDCSALHVHSSAFRPLRRPGRRGRSRPIADCRIYLKPFGKVVEAATGIDCQFRQNGSLTRDELASK